MESREGREVGSAVPHPRHDPEIVEGGDRACGELLLVLAARSRVLPGGTCLRLFATDPAAVLDLPAWCHLTGHDYLGNGADPAGRPYYDLRLAAEPRTTQEHDPWRLEPEPSSNPHREEHP